jgi:hypothetical protein
VVDRLSEARVRVLAPHTNQDKAARDRFRAGYPHNHVGARGSVEKRMAAFLKARHYSGRTMATQLLAQLLARLRAAAAGCAGEVETRARRRSLCAWSQHCR